MMKSAFLLALVILMGCTPRGDQKSAAGSQSAQSDEKPRLAVNTEVVQFGTFVEYGEYIGEAHGKSEVFLTAGVKGRVDRVLVSDGDTITAGQSLAEIDPAQAQMRYETAILSERLARDGYEQEQLLLKQGHSFQTQGRASPSQMVAGTLRID